MKILYTLVDSGSAESYFMNTTTSRKIVSDPATAASLKELPDGVFGNVTFLARLDDGSAVEIPKDLGLIFSRLISSLNEGRDVTIAFAGEELTSTVAAQILGVSRPTLIKWANDGLLPSHKVGTHHKFNRADVFAFRDARRGEQNQAFNALRQFDIENPELTDD